MTNTLPSLALLLGTLLMPITAPAQETQQARVALANAWADDFSAVDESDASVTLTLVRDGVKHEIRGVTSLRVSGPLLLVEYVGGPDRKTSAPRRAVVSAEDIFCLQESDS